MRYSVILLAWVLGALCAVSSVSAGIEYHFVPGMNGQPDGYAQFAEIAPEVGPADFKVRISGAMVGYAPTADPNKAHAYLDKWGLGVRNPIVGKDKGVQGQVQLDGKNGGEYIRLEFEVAVQLTQLTFASVGIADRFDLVADGKQVDLLALFPGTPTIMSISKSQGNWPGEIDFTKAAEPVVFAKVWDVVTGYPGYGDGVQLENVGVKAIPEPSTLALWSACLVVGGFTVLRRRRVTRQTNGRAIV